MICLIPGMITNSGSVLIPPIGLTQLMKGTAQNLRAPSMSVMQVKGAILIVSQISLIYSDLVESKKKNIFRDSNYVNEVANSSEIEEMLTLVKISCTNFYNTVEPIFLDTILD